MALDAEKLVREFNTLKGLRKNWDSHWEEVALHVLPRKDNIYSSKIAGEKRTQKLFDASAIQANELLASALHGMLTNPATTWFELTTGDVDLDRLDSVRFWLQDSVRRINNVLNNTNFQTEIHEVYTDLGCFGTASMRIIEDKEKVVRFDTRPIYESYVAENSKGQIDTIWWEFKWDKRQVMQEFPNIDDPDVLRDLEGMKDHSKVEILQGVFPAKDGDLKNTRNKFVSVTIMKKRRKIIHESGFREFPYVVPRWTKSSGEMYGRSPAMKALPDIKMINEMMKTTIRAAQKIVDPPLMLPDDGVLLPVKTTPGGLNYYRAGTGDRIEPLRTEGRVDIGLDLIEKVRGNIREAFFVDQLQLNEGPQMTATEVLQRTEEKLRLLGPVLGRQQFELLGPLVDRVFSIMLRRDQLAEAPEELEGLELQVRYSSMIARAQRVSESSNMTRAIELLAPIAQAQPQVLDNIDGDNWLRHTFDIFALPQDIIKTQDEVEAEREARLQAQQQVAEEQQAAQEAENIGRAGPTVVKALEG